ncbi:leptomycin B resistance protein pmd1 [Trichodelitschia bisporula]|uniref:Leptomycin B resistance protein pmd1 n=1 Tax=Trichodelitschia bisporula TaxID=703511 RepID=A0A6G1I0V8_9PEZI|nr:leptomycin B resistance protein pmd1 [Trichodelitschia bisporula]
MIMDEKVEARTSVGAVAGVSATGPGPVHAGPARVDGAPDVIIAVAGEKEGNEGAKTSVGNFFRIFTFGNGFDWTLVGVCVLSAIGAGVAMPLMFIVFGNLVGDFAGYFVPDSTVTRAEFQKTVNKNALYIFYLFIGKFCLSYTTMFTIRMSGLRISAALRLAYLKALFAQPVSIIDGISPGKISSRLTSSANTIQLGISMQFSMFIQTVALVIGLYVVAFVRSWLLTLVASVCLPFILVVYSAILPFFIKFHKATEAHQEEASAFAHEIFASIRIVKAFGAEARLSAKHDESIEKARKSELRNTPLMGLLLAPMFFAVYGTIALAFWFGIRQFVHGHLAGIGPLTTVLFSIMVVVTSIGGVASPIISMAKAATASQELFITIDAEVPDTSGKKGPEVSAEQDVTFRDVSFVYPSRPDVQVLDHLDATFPRGKVTAIVGPSGSGKSTIVGLVERWYDLGDQKAMESAIEAQVLKSDKPDKADKPGNTAVPAEPEKKEPGFTGGDIFIGNTNLKEIDAKWWRSQIGLVQQEPFLFNTTIFENVSYGLSGTQWENESREVKLKMVQSACQEASADEFVSKLPLAYETIVGESGIKLSGGQRQRLAIARSIIKQPSILILDEATSSIDVRTEQVVQKALDRVSQNRTTIVIAHRLSTIKKADKIFVLRRGQVVEEGTHEELLKDEDGLYYGLVHAQALETAGEDTPEDISFNEAARLASREVPGGSGPSNAEPSADEVQPSANTGFYQGFGRLIYEQRRHWLLYSIVITCAVSAGASYPLQAFLFSKLVNAFTLAKDKLVKTGNFWSLMFFILALAMALFYFTLGFAAHIVSTIVSSVYRKEYLQNILKRRVAFFDADGNSAGTLAARLASDPGQVEQLTGGQMAMAYISIFGMVGCIIIAFVYGWKLSLLSVFTIVPVILTAGFFRFRLEMKFEEMNAAVFADSSQFGTEAVGAFRTVKSLVLEDLISDRYENLLQTHARVAFKKARMWTLVFALSDSVTMACQALVFWYGGRLLASHEYNLQQYFVIYMAVVQGSEAAGIWFSMAPNMAEATAGANRIVGSRVLDSESSLKLEPGDPGSEGVGLEFRDVHFAYKSRAIPVLTGLNLKIDQGQFVALVGASGCGKSTVISLIERFYDPDSGHILYGDQDVTQLNVSSYRSGISLVAQESTLYEGSIRENVAMSVEADQATDAAIEEACKDAQIHEFVASLPEGYATQLGPKGLSLSGGQRQRLALARALLRKPRILLLDEATSSLDSESEKLVQEAIERAAGEGGRTVIAVAHRLATIQKADVIFVLGSGRVLEQGTHQSLLKAKGMYYSMCQAQALDK